MPKTERNEKQAKHRLLTLRSAADICISLRNEIPAFARLLEQTAQNLQHLAKEYGEYEQNLEELRELRVIERKPPQRVNMSKRRKPEPPSRIPTRPIALPDDPLGMTRALRNIQVHTNGSCEDKEYYEANPDQGGPNGSRQRCNCGPADTCDLCRVEA